MAKRMKQDNEWWFGELMHYRREGWSLEWISRKLRVSMTKLQASIDKYGYDPGLSGNGN